jgi:hypothetical protein
MGRTSPRTHFGVALALFAFALAGCTSATVSSESSSATAPQPAAKPALTRLVLTPDSLGDIRIGKPVPSTTLIAKYDATACEFKAMGTPQGSASSGAWEANYPSPTGTIATRAPFVIVTTRQQLGSPVRGLWVWAPGIHTSKGITVGSSRAQVQAAYPHPNALTHGPLSDVYVLDGSGGRLLIEVARSDNNDIGYWSPSQVDSVLWMGAIAPGGSVASIAGTDNIPAACPDIEN